MYKVNIFSKITGLPISTLRYYDREHILQPRRDPENNYRFYSNDDYQKASIISTLRQHHFSIAEIKDITETITCEDDLCFYLNEKKAQLIEDIKSLSMQCKEIDLKVSKIHCTELIQNYEIDRITVDNQYYMYLDYSGDYNDMGMSISQLYQHASPYVCGPLFLLDGFEEDNDCRICLPIIEYHCQDTLKTDIIHPQMGYRIIHKGAHATIGGAYKSLIDSFKDKSNNHPEQFMTRFIKGPGKLFKGNPDHYVTEIILLGKKEEEDL